MADQLKLDNNQLIDLIDCHITKEDYIDILEEKDDDLEIIPRGY